MKIRITIYLFIPEALIFYHRLDTVPGNWDITRTKLEEKNKSSLLELSFWRGKKEEYNFINTVPGAVKSLEWGRGERGCGVLIQKVEKVV